MKIQEELEKWIPKENIKIQELMKNHTSFKIGGPADYFVKITKREELKAVMSFVKSNRNTSSGNRKWFKFVGKRKRN